MNILYYRTSNIGQLLNGLAGPITFGAPPVLSALWFPAGQRTTATALNTVLNTVSFIVEETGVSGGNHRPVASS
jgi:hypothetical protein